MSRLIDAEKIDFNEVFGGQSDFAKDTRVAAQSLIDTQPTVEAKEVVHGEWKISADGYYPYCSECKNEPKSGEMTDFCPYCGADMRKKV